MSGSLGYLSLTCVKNKQSKRTSRSPLLLFRPLHVTSDDLGTLEAGVRCNTSIDVLPKSR